MLRILLGLVFLASCSMGTVKTGGEESYVYDARSEYTKADLAELSSKVVTTSQRDPRVGKLDELFSKKQKPLKRVGIIVFESVIQPTRGGLSGADKIYMSEQGKQLLTEKYLSIWQQTASLISSDVQFVPISQIKRARTMQKYGSEVEDYVKSARTSFAPDDIFFMESGKKSTLATIMNPRGMRDMSFLLVPATELMGGPKWSEHNKQFLNELMKELKLDAALIVMSDVSWTAAHKDKYTDEFIPEEIKFKISASTLLSLTQYNQRLEVIGNKEKADVTLCYRAYESKMKIPVYISVPEMDQNFDMIEKDLLNPMLKTYKDLSQMTLMRIIEDLKKTW